MAELQTWRFECDAAKIPLAASQIRKNPFGWQSASYPVQHVLLSRTFLRRLLRPRPSRGKRSIFDAVRPLDQSDVASGTVHIRVNGSYIDTD